MRALDYALSYHAVDLAVLPLPARSKEPALSWGAWAYSTQTEADVVALFNRTGKYNILALGGLPSKNLVILDADCGPVRAEVETRLDAAGIATWAVTSNTTGPHKNGCAFFTRTPLPAQSQSVTLGSGKLEVRGAGSYALLPPSRHPSGAIYTTLAGSPAEIFTLPTMTALDWLPLQPAPPPERERRIPRLAWRLLQNDAASVGKYQSRSEAEAAIVASLIRAGYDFPEIAHLFTFYPGPGKFAEKYAARPKTALAYLLRTFHNEQDFVTTHASDAERKARELRAWALSRPWTGQTGSTDRAVYLAHLALVERCGQSPHGASARELAELAGVHWHTVMRANHRLVGSGLLTLDVHSTASLSARYTLVLPSGCYTCDHSINQYVMEWSQAYHDAFRRSGLGKTGADVWQYLKRCGNEGRNVTTIARATGRARQTVKRKLARMYQLGMAEPLGAGHWRALPGADLDRIAHELGTAGAGDAQRSRHAADRRLHNAVLVLGRARARGKVRRARGHGKSRQSRRSSLARRRSSRSG